MLIIIITLKEKSHQRDSRKFKTIILWKSYQNIFKNNFIFFRCLYKVFWFSSPVTNFFTRRDNLIESVRLINPNLSGLKHIAEIFLYHQEYFDKTNNTNILDATIKYFIETEKFDRLLFLVSLNIVAFSTDFDFEMNIYIIYI